MGIFLTSMKCVYVMRLFSYLMIVHVEFSQVNYHSLDSNLFFPLNRVYESIFFT